MSRVFRSSRFPVAVFLALTWPMASAQAATIYEIQFQGSTDGCFETDCPTMASPADWSVGGTTVYFTGSSFDEMSDLTGAAAIALGTFSRDAVFTSAFSSLDFTLQVTFVLPSAISGGQSVLIDAVIAGTVTTGNSLMSIDFDDLWNAGKTITFANSSGEGSFVFALDDPEALNKNQNSRPVAGSIQDAVFREFETLPPTAVPEPASLLLLGTGLGAIAMRVRRRRTRQV